MPKISFKIEYEDGVVDEIATTETDLSTRAFILFLGKCYRLATYCNDLEVNIQGMQGAPDNDTIIIKGCTDDDF